MKSLYRLIIFGILVNLFGGTFATTLAAEPATQNSSYIEVTLSNTPAASFKITATRQLAFGGNVQDDFLNFTRESNGKYLSDPINHLSGGTGASINCSGGPTTTDNQATTARDTFNVKITDNASAGTLATAAAVFCNQPYPTTLGLTMAPTTPGNAIQYGGIKGTFTYTSDSGGTKPFQRSSVASVTNTATNVKTTVLVNDNGQITKSVNGPAGNMQLAVGSYQLNATYNPTNPNDGVYTRFIQKNFTVTKNTVTDVSALAVKSTDLNPGSGPGTGTTDSTDCNADSFSWIVCPMVSIAGKTIDAAQIVLTKLLAVQPLAPGTDMYNSTYPIWQNIRNVADIFFVLIFFIVIFGTGLGMDNYTVKKILPKLIAAAILVQFSYWIAGFIIDIGNILGYGVKALFTVAGVGGTAAFDFTSGQSFSAALVGTGLLVAGLIGAAVALSATAVIGALIAMVMLVGTLLVRQIMIILLVVLSPLAMAAWVLPNTERIFQYWYKNLIRAVLLFPLIMVLLSSAKLFSQVAMAAVGGQTSPLGPTIGLIAYILPLFLIPMTFKMAGTLMNLGAAGVAKLGGAANKQWGAGSSRDKAALARKQLNNSERALSAKNPLSRSIASKRAGFGFKPTAQNMTAMAGIASKEDKAKLDAAERKLAGASIPELTTAAKSSDVHQARAAIAKLASKNQTGALEEVLAENKLFGGDAGSAEWQKAISGKEGDLFKLAPHLVNPSHDYGKSSAESVAGLSEEGFTAWKNATSADHSGLATKILDSSQLSNRLSPERAAELKTLAASNGSTTASAPTPVAIPISAPPSAQSGVPTGAGSTVHAPTPTSATVVNTTSAIPATQPAQGSSAAPSAPTPVASAPQPSSVSTPQGTFEQQASGLFAPSTFVGPRPDMTPPGAGAPGSVIHPNPGTTPLLNEREQLSDETIGDDRSMS